MDMLTLLTSWGVAVIGMTVWAVRLEGRVNTQSARQDDLREFFGEKLEDLKKRLEQIDAKVERRNGRERNDH